MISGNISYLLAGYGPKFLQKSNYELFYVPKSINEALLPNGDHESLYIELEASFLEDIAETYGDARALLDALNSSSDIGIPMVSVSINYVASAIIKKIYECKKTGGNLVIDLHRYIVELLTEYVAGINDEEMDEKRIIVPHKPTLIKIKQEIMNSPHIHRQAIKILSSKFGISLTELKKNFKAFFGINPGGFVRFHALTKGHYLITTTERSIDDIADEVGYRYRINFDKSFKKQFGYLPSSLRENSSHSDQIH
jgi:AraC-like DNA-binding protein